MQSPYKTPLLKNREHTSSSIQPLFNLRYLSAHTSNTSQDGDSNPSNTEETLASISTQSQVTSLCFLTPLQQDESELIPPQQQHDDDVNDDNSSTSSSSSSSLDLTDFQCHTRILPSFNTKYQHDLHNTQNDENDQPKSTKITSNDSTAVDIATFLCFEPNSYLVSCHADGEARLWDINRQSYAFSLVGKEGQSAASTTSTSSILPKPNPIRGPGLTVQRVHNNNQPCILYQTRDRQGTITIHDIHRNGSNVVNT